ncbi:MAG TPA: SIMPL domain-containing protein [Caulobacteraceae bacterium]|nr:SIMPL domain-containing protein [Caulobacteraceae bacterium]
MKTLLRTALLASAVLAAASVPALAQDAQSTLPVPYPGQIVVVQQGPTLNLSAYGETRVAPDMAMINLGVVTEATTAAEAMRQNRERMVQVIAALKKQGIAEKDVQTSGLNLSPQYTYRENLPPELRGYQASNQVTVRVFDLARLGQAVDAVVSAGSNQVNGISFGLKDPQTAENAARLAAVKNLQAKAQLYASATGMRVKSLRTLSEGGGFMVAPPPVAYKVESAMADAGASTPVAAGELTLRVDVTAVYELEK